MKEVFTAALSVVKRLQEAGHETYFAGGWVRDFLLEHPSDDIDIATTASVEQMQHLFEKTIPVGIAFGILIIVEQGHQFEVATFRTERGYVDGRRPTEITPATPKEDALRRDFTINGMYYDPIKDELIDYVDGQRDLKRKIVRAIGDPSERFREDRLRMIRAVRYAARLSFTIEEATWNAVTEHAHLLFPSVAIERVWNEFTKMARYTNFDVALGMLHRIGLLATIFPELEGVSFETIQERVSPLRNCPKKTPPILLLLLLFQDHTLEEKIKIGRYLKVSNKELEHIESYHLFKKEAKKKSHIPYDLVQILAHPDWALYLQIFTAPLDFETRKKCMDEYEDFTKKYASHISRMQNKTPLVSAEDLIQQGIKPGPILGKLLKEAEMLAINESLSKEAILARISEKSGIDKDR